MCPLTLQRRSLVQTTRECRAQCSMILLMALSISSTTIYIVRPHAYIFIIGLLWHVILTVNGFSTGVFIHLCVHTIMNTALPISFNYNVYRYKHTTGILHQYVFESLVGFIPSASSNRFAGVKHRPTTIFNPLYTREKILKRKKKKEENSLYKHTGLVVIRRHRYWTTRRKITPNRIVLS